jgi:hypothetical protein
MRSGENHQLAVVQKKPKEAAPKKTAAKPQRKSA